MEPFRTQHGARAILAASFGNLLEWYDFAARWTRSYLRFEAGHRSAAAPVVLGSG